MTTAAPDTARHRALADPRRASIVAELEGASAGLAASELAHRLCLHENTIRWHLGVLMDAELVRSDREPRDTPGRPRILYSLAGESLLEPGHSRVLAAVLAGQGFDPEVADDRLILRRCPFRELAEENRRICSVHREMIDGTLRELGSPLAVSRLEIPAAPSACIAHLAPVRG
jgi:predicted ArsR family transcriptional regulator